MKITNRTGNGLSHSLYEGKDLIHYYLGNGETKDIPDNIAKIWLKFPGVDKYIDQADLERAEKEAKAKAEAEKKALEEKNKALEAELEKLKKGKDEEVKTVAAKKAPSKKKK